MVEKFKAENSAELKKLESEIEVSTTQLTACEAKLKENKVVVNGPHAPKEAVVNRLQAPKEAVLLLSTRFASNVPIVIDFEGKKPTTNIQVKLLFIQVTLMMTPFSHMERTLKFMLPVRQHFMTKYGLSAEKIKNDR